MASGSVWFGGWLWRSFDPAFALAIGGFWFSSLGLARKSLYWLYGLGPDGISRRVA
jgi:hypothetical protein